MKKLLFIGLIGFGGWQYYSNNIEEKNSFSNVSFSAPIQTKTQTVPRPSYTCDGRQHCSQMRSYEEAKYFISHCPNTKMDGDHDGIPCERQFNK
ncbi:excalibur calcium-binding domain-containing protein [Neptunomonas antarctica]|uniref:excalibur calcium-binding domain-containing protein n=1 Tax=Neptunomonas antarctica TaxID=619304 RepID=UPI0009708EA9|nr:excalibur calcium-binding domain-containing protein [Neptunomonas antarctica]